MREEWEREMERGGGERGGRGRERERGREGERERGREGETERGMGSFHTSINNLVQPNSDKISR